ncbi:hypothetical protein D3C79_926220 [compost metagenome]
MLYPYIEHGCADFFTSYWPDLSVNPVVGVLHMYRITQQPQIIIRAIIDVLVNL